MRKDWFSVHVAAAVAAPFLIVLNAHVALAQGNTASVTSTEVSETTSTTTSTTGTQEVGAPLGATPTNLDAPSDSAAPALPGDEVLLPLAAMGDDALPSLRESQNNPYLRANTAGMQTGRTAGGQEFGAFIPPPLPKVEQAGPSEDNTELRTVLGDEVFDRRVNISTQANTDVEEVIRILAEKADLNFVYGEGVIQGKITLNLKDVPLGVALQSLLSTQDLAIVREGENVMRIAPRKLLKPGVTADMRTVYIKLNWVPGDALSKTLTAAVQGSGGKIQAHPDTNTLIITDTPTNVAIIRDLISQLDVPEKQVMIEARMVELLLSAGRELGSQVNLTKHDGSGNSPLVPGEPPGNLEGIITSLGAGTGNRLAFGSVFSILGNSYDLGVALDGLETRNVVHTLANPRVITLNNQQANIEITRDIPYIESGQGPTQGSTIENVEFKQSSVRLNVLPVITNNGYVRMKLEPKQEILNGFAFNQIPIIDTRSAQTNVIVKDEDTVVLGGLRQISASDSKTEYPWLAKSPVLGWFFKGDNKNHEKNDLMLFVTPHIVKAPTLTPAENYKYTRIDAHWDLPDYFFDDSVGQREARHRFEADMDPRNYYQQDLLLPMPGAEGSVESSVSSYGVSSDGGK